MPLRPICISYVFLALAVLQVSRVGPRPRLDGGIWPLDALAMRLTESYDMEQDDGPPGLALAPSRSTRGSRAIIAR